MSIRERPFYALFLQRCAGYFALSGRSVAATIPRGEMVLRRARDPTSKPHFFSLGKNVAPARGSAVVERMSRAATFCPSGLCK